MMRTVLNGWGDIPTGLGSELRWMWSALDFSDWYQAKHPILGFGEGLDDSRPVWREGLDWDGRTIDADVVVAVERFCPTPLVRSLHARKTRMVVLANPEQGQSLATWTPYLPTVVSRSAQGWRHLKSLGVDSVRVGIPIDLREFPFRQRDSVDRIAFTNGWGGTHQRKGLPEVRRMLDDSPGCVDVYSQREVPGLVNHGPVATGADLYANADLMLMPSRFEGVGLPLLEAMASGCLVAATNAEPMNEFMHAAYGPYAEELLLPVASVETVEIGRQEWPSSLVDPWGALDVLSRARAMPAAQVRELSLMGRRYVEREHATVAAEALRQIIWGDS